MSASCTMRYADSPTAPGPRPVSPATPGRPRDRRPACARRARRGPRARAAGRARRRPATRSRWPRRLPRRRAAARAAAASPERRAPAVLDRGERRASGAGPVAEQRGRRLRLHDDRAHVVRDHVVQLARDAQALLAHGALRQQPALALEQRRALAEGPRRRALLSHGLAEQPRAAEHHALDDPAGDVEAERPGGLARGRPRRERSHGGDARPGRAHADADTRGGEDQQQVDELDRAERHEAARDVDEGRAKPDARGEQRRDATREHRRDDQREQRAPADAGHEVRVRGGAALAEHRPQLDEDQRDGEQREPGICRERNQPPSVEAGQPRVHAAHGSRGRRASASAAGRAPGSFARWTAQRRWTRSVRRMHRPAVTTAFLSR